MSEHLANWLPSALQTMAETARDCIDESFAAYRYVGSAPDDCCDAVVAWLERIRPQVRQQGVLTAGQCELIPGTLDIAIRVMRSCWPVQGDDRTDPLPEPAVMNEAAGAFLSDGIALWCCVTTGLVDGSFLPQQSSGEAVAFAPSDLVPEGPRGGCAGWTVRFSIYAEPCGCWPPPDAP